MKWHLATFKTGSAASHTTGARPLSLVTTASGFAVAGTGALAFAPSRTPRTGGWLEISELHS